MDGILNICKQKDYTSHDVVAVVRRILHQKKVGHTGTLDPAAEGVLPVCVGRATKLADYIMAEKKGYRAVVTFGVTTDTQDAQGQILKTLPVCFDEEKIQLTVNAFKGEIWQLPPMYSAIKIQGKKLYQLAREGKEVEREKRKITIHSLVIRQFLPPNQIELDIVCSKGTYIRTLAADIGESLGCGGHMASLTRTQSGQFTLDTAITLADLQKMADEGRLLEALMPMDVALGDINRIWASEQATKIMHNGAKIYAEYFTKSQRPLVIGERTLAFDSQEELIGIYEVVQDDDLGLFIKPLKMLREVLI